MVEKNKKQMMKPLQTIDPALYRYIATQLNEQHNIHAHDTDILAIKEQSGLTIILKYGEHFSHTQQDFFTYDTLNNRDEEFLTFLHNTADKCKEAMITEYFKMMKP